MDYGDDDVVYQRTIRPVVWCLSLPVSMDRFGVGRGGA